MEVLGNSCIGMDEGGFPVFASGHAQHCIGADGPRPGARREETWKCRSASLSCRRSGRFVFEIRIMADVVSLLMLRSKFKACSFTTLCARGESFARLQVAEVGHAVLIVVHPIQSAFGNRRPRRESLPEHIRSFEKQNQAIPSTYQLSFYPEDKEPYIKVFLF